MTKKRTLAIALCLMMVFALMPAGQIFPDVKAAELPQAGLNYDQYPALREAYKDYFLVGTIDRFDSAVRTEFMNYTYNSVTHENNLKPEQTQNTKGIFTLESARNTISNAKASIEGVQMVGHTLTWHSQSPNWLWDAPTFDRETALANLNAHIDGVLGAVGGELYSIDVVNEAIGPVSADNPADWKAALNKGEGWALALGWEWVELAFVRAAKIVDENGWDCKLYYNEFSLESASKARALYEMVKDINERYAGQRPNGKLLIEGIGYQGHCTSSVKTKDVEAAVELLATLPGVKLSFTELDMEFMNEGTLTQAQATLQAQKYAKLFQIFKKYAAGPANTTGNPKVIERVTFWGTDDGGSWKNMSLPLLFNAPRDGQITAKEALLGVLWPDEYLAEHPLSEEEEVAEEIHVPGVHVFSTNRDDIWSGANIILGTNAEEWPWSSAYTDADDEEDFEAAFIPEKDETYRLSFSYTALGTIGIRVRWIKDNTNGSYTAMDGQVVKTPPYSTNLSPNDVATMVPAHFNQGMVNAGTYTLVTEIKMDGSLPAEDLVGNLAIRGTQGGNSFEINWIKMEKVSTGEVMFVWDPLNPPEPEVPESESEEPAISEAPAATDAPASAAPQEPEDTKDKSKAIIIVIVVIVVLAAAVAVFGFVQRKRK